MDETTTPKRIQRKRVKGWRMPPNAKSVTRPGRWGNPYKAGETVGGPLGWRIQDPHEAVARFRAYAENRLREEPDWLEPLRGFDLACYCRPNHVCHADVLLELAND